MGKGGAHSFAHRIVSGLDTDLKAGVGLTAEANDEVTALPENHGSAPFSSISVNARRTPS